MAVTTVKEPLNESEMECIQAALKDSDLSIPVDCADPRVQFTVMGWFILPKGSLTKPHDLELAS